MKAGAFISQIQSAASVPDKPPVSREFILMAITDESRMVSMMFPTNTTVDGVQDADNEYLMLAGGVRPSTVIQDGFMSTKIMPHDFERLTLGFAGLSGRWWCAVSEGVLVFPAGGSVRISGDMKPSDWATLSEDPSFDSTEIGDLDGVVDADLMSLVFYRAVQKACEAAGAFDKAQYYLAVGDRKERELKRFWTPGRTSYLGFMEGHDF